MMSYSRTYAKVTHQLPVEEANQCASNSDELTKTEVLVCLTEKSYEQVAKCEQQVTNLQCTLMIKLGLLPSGTLLPTAVAANRITYSLWLHLLLNFYTLCCIATRVEAFQFFDSLGYCLHRHKTLWTFYLANLKQSWLSLFMLMFIHYAEYFFFFFCPSVNHSRTIGPCRSRGKWQAWWSIIER